MTLSNPIEIQDMADGQVDDGMYDKYLNELMVFGDRV